MGLVCNGKKSSPRSYIISAAGRYNFSQRMISPLYTESTLKCRLKVMDDRLDEGQMITGMQIVVPGIESAAVDEAGGEDGSY